MKFLLVISFFLFLSCMEKEEKCGNWTLIRSNDSIDSIDLNGFQKTYAFLDYLEMSRYYNGNKDFPKFYSELEGLKLNFTFDNHPFYCGINPYSVYIDLGYDDILFKPEIAQISLIKLKDLQDSLRKRWNKEYIPCTIIIRNSTPYDTIKKSMYIIQNSMNDFLYKTSLEKFGKDFCTLDSTQIVKLKDSLYLDVMISEYREILPPPPKIE